MRRRTGTDGRVVDVDITDEQLAKARRLADEASFAQVELRAGYIEGPPLDDGGFDCAISNGVINLSPAKPAVFAAAARALRPGGRLALADIVSDKQMPEGVTCDASLWAACIGGPPCHSCVNSGVAFPGSAGWTPQAAAGT